VSKPNNLYVTSDSSNVVKNYLKCWSINQFAFLKKVS